MSQKQLTVDQINQYNQDGFLILKDFLGHEEVTKLHQIVPQGVELDPWMRVIQEFGSNAK